MEEMLATEEMKKFFEKLLSLKSFVNEKQKEQPTDKTMKEIYKRLDEIIKEKK